MQLEKVWIKNLQLQRQLKTGKFELDDLNSNLSELKAKKRKLSGQALSTIMTLEEVITNAVRKGMDKEPTAASTVREF